MSLRGIPHDSTTIEPLLQQMKTRGQPHSEELIYNCGGKGRQNILNLHITSGQAPQDGRGGQAPAYQFRTYNWLFKNRSSDGDKAIYMRKNQPK